MFIVFEGADGTGKTTQINLFSEYLLKNKISFIKTREPGGTEFGENIRKVFKEQNMTPVQELFLIAAAREDHIKKVILPNLRKKSIVLCDRFIDSTYIYQHIINKIPLFFINQINKFLLDGLIPDLTIVFSCSKIDSVIRLNRDNTIKKDRFDILKFDINNSYVNLVKEEFTYPCGRVPRRVIVDSTGSKEVVFKRVSEMADTSEKVELTKEQTKKLVELIAIDLYNNRDSELSKEAQDKYPTVEALAKSYVPGLLNNWLIIMAGTL